MHRLLYLETAWKCTRAQASAVHFQVVASLGTPTFTQCVTVTYKGTGHLAANFRKTFHIGELFLNE